MEFGTSMWAPVRLQIFVKQAPGAEVHPAMAKAIRGMAVNALVHF